MVVIKVDGSWDISSEFTLGALFLGLCLVTVCSFPHSFETSCCVCGSLCRNSVHFEGVHCHLSSDSILCSLATSENLSPIYTHVLLHPLGKPVSLIVLCSSPRRELVSIGSFFITF